MSKITQPEIEWKVITPAIAYDWLETVNNRNRPVSDHTVKQYARDMAEGRWVQRSTTPIKFDTDGVLLDGQHRLWAIVESQTTQEMLVITNVAPEERQVQDIGLKRTVRHIISFEGRNFEQVAIAISNRMLISYRSGSYHPTHTESRDYLLAHEEAINWTLEKLGTRQRGIKQAALLAPVARAWYSQDRERLARFLEIMRTGITTDPAEIVAILLRNQVIASSRPRASDTRELYPKAERALVAFLRGETLSKLVGCTEEQFPIPSDQANIVTLKPKKQIITRAKKKIS